MSLLEKKSLLDRPTLGSEGNVVGGGPGVRFFGNMKGNSSPFYLQEDKDLNTKMIIW